MTHSNAAACLMGALVADAASLGLHWIYDPARIAEVAQAQGAAFAPLDPGNFGGIPAYYAHGARQDGDLTQYGEVLAVMIRSLNTTDHFDASAFQAAYAAHFGPGGTYIGYIDRVMRGTLANLAAGHTDPSGIDDDQLPAVAGLPAVVVAHLGRPDLSTTVAAAIRVTNVNDTALDYGMAFAALLAMVLNGQSVTQALAAIATGAQGDLGDALKAALADTGSSTDYGEVTGRACHLPMALPLCFHILANHHSFATAVEANILAGGDSAGRAIIIGAVMGAAYGMGDKGIPPGNLLQMRGAANLWQACQSLAKTP
jgi:ADP-ribosylglycohydrolase